MVAYGMRLLFDPTQPTKAITLQLLDASNANLSAAAIVITLRTIDGAPVSGQPFSYVKNGSYYNGIAATSGPWGVGLGPRRDPSLDANSA